MSNQFDKAISLETYLKNGGVLSKPSNLPARYRADLVRLMTSFIDSELAASAGYALVINKAPGLDQRINMARIILEKVESGERVLSLLMDLGVETNAYNNSQHLNNNINWSTRLPRHGDINGLVATDMRAPMFHYPFSSWSDAAMMSVLIGKAGQITLHDLCQVSYAPLAEAFSIIKLIEQRHTNIFRDELLRLAKGAYKNGTSQGLKTSFFYWLPKIRAIFGSSNSDRFERLKAFGLRRRSNGEMLAEFNLRAEELRQSLKIIAKL
ncbi:phenylacetate-CoA oxygenase subunit PaaI (plasmid) [Bartonella sp. HY329]|uniref:Phenylacetic acid catabolic protein n=1 Tax=unclassified Bartonella TaxID=2645622 RepID=UPI0021C88EB1|nr:MULTISPECIES: Phenylacetic acid catabolic protein [unclassified Bartonella]UXM96473.1 phenylacetate-CoA oxygenase subunit PaaI [Bartonella sp. HY329]UXN10796.1 phenylacetate-CoA oxygenase subunit PaaI [Bartonella sp. HY328]